jgi:predicted O-methyltransferase YrrM
VRQVRRLATQVRLAFEWRARRLRRALVGLATRGIELAGPTLGREVVPQGRYDFVRRSMYSPVPEVPPASWDGWHSRHPLPGVRFDLDRQVRYLERELGPYLGEFRPPAADSGSDEFHLDNGYYFRGEAEVLYAIIRRHTPRQVLELGGGFSTLVSAEACVANARAGNATQMTSVDPEPRTPLPERLAGTVRREVTDARELPLERFLALEADDVLFIDTTHTVKRGSEVNRLVLEVLPRLRPGVLVHFHDIFLPYEYPQHFLARGLFLSEQYLVHALLIESSGWEVLLGVHALARERAEPLRAAIPSFEGDEPLPSALWLRREA